MKKTIVVFVIGFITILFACHKKAVPTATQQPPSPPLAPAGPVYASADIEAGKVIYSTRCTKCHAAKIVEAYTVDRWVGILKAMVPKAKLDSVQTMQVTAYVNTNAMK